MSTDLVPKTQRSVHSDHSNVETLFVTISGSMTVKTYLMNREGTPVSQMMYVCPLLSVFFSLSFSLSYLITLLRYTKIPCTIFYDDQYIQL